MRSTWTFDGKELIHCSLNSSWMESEEWRYAEKICILAFLFLPSRGTTSAIFQAKTSRRSNHCHNSIAREWSKCWNAGSIGYLTPPRKECGLIPVLKMNPASSGESHSTQRMHERISRGLRILWAPKHGVQSNIAEDKKRWDWKVSWLPRVTRSLLHVTLKKQV